MHERHDGKRHRQREAGGVVPRQQPEHQRERGPSSSCGGVDHQHERQRTRVALKQTRLLAAAPQRYNWRDGSGGAVVSYDCGSVCIAHCAASNVQGERKW